MIIIPDRELVIAVVEILVLAPKVVQEVELIDMA